ncbi:potassium channel family protein [Roseibium sediminicola]|uniref:Potassium channel family protein n=1 Tax=Roseibium sediminicola TaxID=2933272 RepID=A0ABT0GMJ1_9HYPH|nr:potassium channel family protein [Roseibium sp. CAU 1639]MCK7610640.1 potassium channel family protein [Roseibium sp. CAU 1639]
MAAFFINLVRLLKAIIRSWKIPAFRSGVLLAVLVLFSGSIFYRTVENWSWIDALYFSAMTAATVGVADLSPQTDLGKIFTVLYLFVGVGVFIALFAQITRALLKLEDENGKD